MKWKTALRLVLGTFLVCNCAPLVGAQSGTTGALTGTVKAPDGAPVPNVTVTLLNIATSQTETTTTQTNGTYGFSALTPGTYSVKYAAQGFKTSQLPSIVINISEAPSVDVTLEVGSANEIVTVTNAETPPAQASSGTLVDSKTITSVPLTTRNFTQVLSMASGSAADVNNAGTLGRGTQTVNANGNTTVGTYTINGALASSTVPNPDTIVEFKIQNSQYDAGYGALVPSTNVITKSGGNDIHGTLFEFLRNDIFNANAFFRNSNRQPKPALKQNQFGGAVGGPIKKDKLFYFGSFQGTRQVNGLDPTALSTLILPPLTNDRSAATIGAEFCPANHPLNPGQGGTNPFATFAGGTQVACDGSNISPVALNILNAKLPDGSGYFMPTPQSISTISTPAITYNLGNSSYSFPATYNENQYMTNADYNVSPKNTISYKLFFATIYQFRTFGAPITSGNPYTPGGPQGLKAHDWVTTLKLTSVLTKDIVNEVRFDFTRNTTYAWGPGIPTATSLGMIPVDKFFNEPPEITINGSLGALRFFGNGQNDFTTLTDTYQWSDNLSYVRGRHSIRTGAFVDTQFAERLDTGPARGKITFQNFTDFLIGQSAAQNGSPSGLSNVKSIIANEGVGPNGEVHYENRTFYGAAFVEDDIKLTPRFTLNTGLRWEYIGPAFDTAGKMGNAFLSLLQQLPIPPAGGTLIGNTVPANYNPNFIDPYTGKPFGPPPTGVLVRSTNSAYQNNTPLDAFAPRLGFAWQPGKSQGRFSVRAGYGWFFQNPPNDGNALNTPLFTAQPFAQGFGNTDASNSTSTLAQPFPVTTLGFTPRTPTSRLSDRIAGSRYKLQLVQQWNLNVQTNLTPTFSLDIGYVGSNGSHLLLQQNLNQPALASATNPVNCGYDGVPADCITSSSASNAALRVPIMGELPTALGANQFIGRSWYHGLQATFRKALSRGLTFQAAYTYSKSENNTNIMNDQNNIALDWARATFDRTQRLIVNYNYLLPTPVMAKGFVRSTLDGWTLSGLVIVQSGSPMTLTDPNGGLIFGSAGISTVTLCPGSTNASIATSGRDQSRLLNWFNSSAICSAPQLGVTSKDTGYGNSGQSIVNGPGQFNTDVSVGKQTTVGGLREDAVLAFRVEFYNTFNHPQFSNPGTTFGTANFGKITQTSVAPRLIQFGLKYIF